MTVHLFTLRDWIATRTEPGSREYSYVRERTIAIASRLPVNEALARLKAYNRALMVEYPMTAYQFDVIGYAALPGDTDPAALLALQVHLAEDLGEAFEKPEAIRIMAEVGKAPAEAEAEAEDPTGPDLLYRYMHAVIDVEGDALLDRMGGGGFWGITEAEMAVLRETEKAILSTPPARG